MFLHGWGCDGAVLRGLVQSVDRLSGGICSIVPDLPGFGKSPVPPVVYGTADYADEIAEFISKNCRQPVIVAGHSFGGRIGVVLAASYPNLVEKIILISGAGLRRFNFKSSIKVFGYKILKFAVNAGLMDKSRIEGYGSADYRTSTGIMRQVFVKVIREDLSSYARNIKCPALLIYGKKDTETPLWMAKKYNSLIKNSRLITIGGAGHYVYVHREYETAKVIAEFLKENGGKNI